VKVIFIADVTNVARAGQTKEVADGYARNFLFPRKLAVVANSQAAAVIDAHLKKLGKQRAIEEAEMAEVAKKISGLEITLRAKVGENEKLYGSITGADIAEALSKAAGCGIDKKKIDLAEPIKQTGVCDVTVRFTHDITAVIKVNVLSEEAPEPEKPAKAEKKIEKAEAPAEEKPAKAEKKPAKEKKEKPAKSEEKIEKAEAPAEEKPAKAEKKPAKEKKAKAPKAEKEEKPAKAEKKEKPAEEKKEKKPRAKAKKTEDAEAKKE